MRSHSFVSSLLSAASVLTAFVSPVVADVRPFNNSLAYENGTYGNYTRQRFLSDRSVVAPVANVYVPAQEGVSPSKHVLWSPVGPYLPPQDAHPMVLDSDTLSLVWFGPRHAGDTMGPFVQECNGTQYITWWAGDSVDHRAAGNFYMYNSRYELVYNVSAVGNLSYADAHEIYLTPQCTAVITAFQPHHHDLSHYNISDGWLLDSYFQEIDLATGELLFQWTASDHVAVTDALWQPNTNKQGESKEIGFDFFHLNSIEKDRFGNYLLSARHTCSLYYISGETGAVIWSIGGKSNSFTDISGGRATDFSWQHHARWYDEAMTQISLYDDRNSLYHKDAEPTSRGMVITLDYAKREVELTHAYMATHGIHSLREGGMQVLSDSPTPGNAFVGYGNEPAWTEFAANGTILWDVAFGPFELNRESADNYRAAKVNWTGMPTWAPLIAPGPDSEPFFYEPWSTFMQSVRDEEGNERVNDTVYFSWNGATEVRSWVVLASNGSEAELSVREHFWAEVPKTGFEDHVHVGAGTKRVVALAVDADDAVLGVTGSIDLGHWDGTSGQGPSDLEALTVEWRALVARQGKGIVFEKLGTGLQFVRARVMSSSKPVLGGIGAAAVLALVAICAVPVWVCCRKRRRDQRRRLAEYEFGLVGEKTGAFDVGTDDEDEEDGQSDGGRSYYGDAFYKKDGESDRSTLRTCSSSSSPTTKSDGSDV